MSLPPVAATETLSAEEIKARAESIIEDLKQYAGADALSLKNTLQRASRDLHATKVNRN